MDIGPANKDLLLNLLSASALRARVIAGNLANQSTPGYERREVRFEESLAKMLNNGTTGEALTDLRPEVSVDKDAEADAIGNTVDLESEVTASRENRLLYELYASILRGQHRLTEIAVRSER